MYTRENDTKASKYLGAENRPNRLKVRAATSIVIDCPPEEVYGYWRNFENLPHFMHNLQQVKVIDSTHSVWKAKGPIGKQYEWEAEITSDRPNEFISWRSLANSEVNHAGSVEFAPEGAGTKVTVTLAYNPPAGGAGRKIAQFLGAAPEQEVEEDLKALKNTLEMMPGRQPRAA